MSGQTEMQDRKLLHKRIRLQLEVQDEDVFRHHNPAYRSGLPAVSGVIVQRIHIAPRGWPHWMYIVELEKPFLLDYENVSPKSRGKTARHFLLEPGLTTDTLPDDEYERYLLEKGLIVGSLWLTQNPQDVPSEMSNDDFFKFPYVSHVKAAILSTEGAEG